MQAAQGIDVTALTTTITGNIATIGLVGVAVLGVVVSVKAFKWIRGAL